MTKIVIWAMSRGRLLGRATNMQELMKDLYVNLQPGTQLRFDVAAGNAKFGANGMCSNITELTYLGTFLMDDHQIEPVITSDNEHKRREKRAIEIAEEIGRRLNGRRVRTTKDKMTKAVMDILTPYIFGAYDEDEARDRLKALVDSFM